MLKKGYIIGLLGISLTGLIVTDASAWMSCYKLPDGSCMWVQIGSLVCGISATAVQEGETKLACTATATDSWAVACGNPGENTWMAPGINIAEFDGTFTGNYSVQAGDVDRNGKASVIISNDVPQGLKDALVAAGACPGNKNWTVLDAVPCDMNVQYKKLDAFGCLVEDLWLHCSTNCSTLEWDIAVQSFVGRDYDCNVTSRNKYQTPICPSTGP